MVLVLWRLWVKGELAIRKAIYSSFDMVWAAALRALTRAIAAATAALRGSLSCCVGSDATSSEVSSCEAAFLAFARAMAAATAALRLSSAEGSAGDGVTDRVLSVAFTTTPVFPAFLAFTRAIAA